MNAVRKILGLCLIIFIGLPILFGVIWAVGMIKASVSAEFLTELPREIIADIPDKADEIFREAQDRANITDADTRAWFQAAAKAGFSPRDLMKRTGLLDWMQGELSESLRQIGLVLRGERRPRPIVVDLRPLKEALLHPEVDRFLEETLNQLPPCDERGLMIWKERAEDRHSRRELPACRPDQAMAKEVLFSARAEAVRDMDNDFEVFGDIRPFPFLRFGLSRAITVLSYFLFLIPAVFILLGSIIAAQSPAGFFRWSGISVLAGSVPALLLALVTKYFSLWAIDAAPFSWHNEWSSELGELVLDKFGWIPARIVDELFSPVIGVAMVASVVGIVLFVVSFNVRNNVRKASASVPAPSSPAQTAEPREQKPELQPEKKAPAPPESGDTGKTE